MGGDSTLSLNQAGIDGDMSDTMSICSKMGQKGEFDRRQKKKYVQDPFCIDLLNLYYLNCTQQIFLEIKSGLSHIKPFTHIVYFLSISTMCNK